MRMLPRFAIAALTIALVMGSVGQRSAEAVIIYQWCASYGGAAGATNCVFATYQQCRQSLAGGGGSCYENPMYNPPAAPEPTQAPRRGKPRPPQ